MNLFSLFSLVLLGLALLAFAGLLTAAIVFNMKAGRRYRQRLAAELQRLRLSRMLGALGIDIDSYLHNERVVDIHHQMHRCETCRNTDTCDEHLQEGAIGSEEIPFCNNEAALQDMVKKKTETT
ncbi:MAG TPA: hypothetical protein ENK12_03010 [Gammaproteobacteria bacterium]|nr:hypothetical protein [Gammaproteobacteria bacterium]